MRFLLKAILPVFIFCTTGVAQSKSLVLSSSKRLSIQYKVGPKETLFSLGRRFYVHPRHLAAFNKISYDKGLSLGQSLLIPLTDSNFSKTDKAGSPIYRPVTGKNKKVVAGYLVKKEFPESTPEMGAVSQTEKSPLDSAIASVSGASVVKSPATPAVKSPVTAHVDIVTPVGNSSGQPTHPLTTEGAGYFKEAFEDQLDSVALLQQSVRSGIFKTTSGWRDAKYYLLTNLADPGTYVKLVSSGTQKTVFAKVLGEMSGIRQNEGYDIRVSNAAAAALGLGESDLFELQIFYRPAVKR